MILALQQALRGSQCLYNLLQLLPLCSSLTLSRVGLTVIYGCENCWKKQEKAFQYFQGINNHALISIMYDQVSNIQCSYDRINSHNTSEALSGLKLNVALSLPLRFNANRGSIKALWFALTPAPILRCVSFLWSWSWSSTNYWGKFPPRQTYILFQQMIGRSPPNCAITWKNVARQD